MHKFEAKPYLLLNTVQNYAWGEKGKGSFIPQFLGIEAEEDQTYAELWIGGHPKAPSKILLEDKEYSINEIIESFPEEILGKRVIEKFGKTFPFLFKILSADEPLSIQVHPTKEQAVLLHAKDPKNYPDNNHKPEIAIAIEELSALIGFKPKDELSILFSEFNELNELAGLNCVEELSNSADISISIKKIFSSLIRNARKDESAFSEILKDICNKIVRKASQKKYESLFLEMHKKYGNDVGLISILMLNYAELKAGEGVYLEAGIPHAYLKGNIVECMANSDNVVRAGLTPKFQDIDTLIEMLTYQTGLPEIISGAENYFVYKTDVEEFEVSRYSLSEEKRSLSQDFPRVLIVLEGEIEISYSTETEKRRFTKGDVVLIPASLSEITMTGKDSAMIYSARVKV